MAPPSIPYLNTYKTYKDGTSRIVTYLVQTAKRCGIDVDAHLTSATDLKKQPKNAIPTIALKSFTELASGIAASTEPKIELPKSIASVIRTVIKLRREAYTFFSKIAKGGPTSTADQGHLHFVEVLEQVLSILQHKSDTSKESEPNEESDIVHDTKNLFEVLTIEEPAEQHGENEATKPPKKTPIKTEPYAYRPDNADSESEAIFALFAFLYDFRYIRAYTKVVWGDYRAGKIDAMTASVTTDTAFSIVKRMTEDLAETAVGKRTYPEICIMLIKYLEKLGGAGPQVGDWLCIDASNILDSYEDVLDPNSIPFLKPGHFGVYNPRADRDKLSDEARYKEDLIVLMEFLPEITTLSRALMHVPAQDELTTGLRKMMDANSIIQMPMYAIFCTQLLLDIHHKLRADVSRPFEQFQAAAHRAVNILNNYFKYSRSRKIVNWSAKNDENLRHLLTFAKAWGTTDQVAKAKHSLMKRMPMEPEPFKLLKSHPILAGLMMFRLNEQLSESGIILSNAWGSIIYPAHLYNAAQKSGGLESKWDDMEYIIALNSATRIFVGNPPSEAQEYWKRFVLALGASATAFARNKRAGGSEQIPEAKKGPRGLKTTSPIRDIFRERYLSGTPAALTNSNIAAMLAVAAKAQRTNAPSVDIPGFFEEQLAGRRPFTAPELLTAVREGMAGEELNLVFDYFGMHQRGYELLRKLQTHLQGDMTRYFGPNWIENESELPYVVGYIFEVMRGSERIAEALRETATGSRVLYTAADVLRSYIEGEKGQQGIAEAKTCTAGAAVRAI